MKKILMIVITVLSFSTELFAQSETNIDTLVNVENGWTGHYSAKVLVRNEDNEFDVDAQSLYPIQPEAMDLQFYLNDQGLLSYQWNRGPVWVGVESDDKTCAKNESGEDKALPRTIVFKADLAKYVEFATASGQGEHAVRVQQAMLGAQSAFGIKQEVLGVIVGHKCEGGTLVKTLEIPVVEFQFKTEDGTNYLHMKAVLGFFQNNTDEFWVSTYKMKKK